MGKWGKSLKILKQAIKLKPNSVDAHYNLAASYLSLGDRPSAMAGHKILLELDQGAARDLYRLITDSYQLRIDARAWRNSNPAALQNK
jgi:tetratricopeptide (TPR) repeat protein